MSVLVTSPSCDCITREAAELEQGGEGPSKIDVQQPILFPPELLLQGYRLGVFPMGMDDGSIPLVFAGSARDLPLDGFKIDHGLRRALAKKKFEIKFDKSFGEVMRACADRDETWITSQIIASYEHLHDLGYAHSVEAWHEGKLAGGLYGVAVGGAFFGESMFHRATDASKVALGRAGGADESAALCASRYPMDDAAPRTIWGRGNFAARVSADARAGGGVKAELWLVDELFCS